MNRKPEAERSHPTTTFEAPGPPQGDARGAGEGAATAQDAS